MKVPYMSLRICVLLGLALGSLVSRSTVAFQIDPQSLAIPADDVSLQGVGPVRRYEWFTNLWMQRRSAWSKMIEQDRGSVVFFGDSITQGWGDDFHGLFPELKVANRGISGDTTRGMLYRLHDDVLAIKPRAVVMLMGTNDLEEKAQPEMIRDNVALILASLKKHNPKMPVILCQIFPSSEVKSRPADKIKATNALIVNLAKSYPQVVVLDTWQPFADNNGNARVNEFPDLLHPNLSGYQKWAEILRPAMQELGLFKGS